MLKLTILGCVIALAGEALSAQVCAPAQIPLGQPSLSRPAAEVFPVCEGMINPLPATGNPNFAIRAFAPAPIPAGSPMFLVITLPAPVIQLGPPVFCSQFGFPALLPDPSQFILAIPAGVSGAQPGPRVSLPIPPGLPQGMVAAVQTGALVTGSSCLALTDGLGIHVDYDPSARDLFEGGSGTASRCTYNIVSIDAPAGNCPIGFKVGNRICVQCPNPNRACPFFTRFRIWVDGRVVCSGRCTRATTNCGAHPCDTDVYRL